MSATRTSRAATGTATPQHSTTICLLPTTRAGSGVVRAGWRVNCSADNLAVEVNRWCARGTLCSTCVCCAACVRRFDSLLRRAARQQARGSPPPFQSVSVCRQRNSQHSSWLILHNRSHSRERCVQVGAGAGASAFLQQDVPAAARGTTASSGQAAQGARASVVRVRGRGAQPKNRAQHGRPRRC